MATRTIDPAAVDKLEGALEGRLIRPDDADYNDARIVYNGMHDRRPALIVMCTSASDVAAAIALASSNGLDLAVRGGGHSGPGFGTCDGGIVADLTPMKQIAVDTEDRTATAGGGCTWKDFDDATHAHGLATTGGTLSSTGIAGLTLGGGFGHLTRRFGLSCDNLLSADVVTASGESVTADEKQNADLFWALRGGGGNFGVVTSFTYRVHPVAEIIGGPIAWPLEAAPDVLGVYAELNENAPDDFGGIAGLAPIPPFPFVDESWHQRPGCLAIVCWTGAPEHLDDAMEPLRSAAEPLGEGIGPMPYPVINTLFDELLPPGLQQYWKGNFAKELPREALAIHVDHATNVPSPESGTFFFPFGGAAARIGHGQTAFGHRDARFNVVVAGAWQDGAHNKANTKWVRDYYKALQPYSEEGGYVNFMASDDGDRIPEGYGQNFKRLQQVKATYDPNNLFHVNHNISPAPS
jgi:FAD/FMN-containing dehydrogenase